MQHPERKGQDPAEDAELSQQLEAEVDADADAIDGQEKQPDPHSKACDLCHNRFNVLIRCQIDKTAKWHLICNGKCWRQVSGGVVDGDGAEEHKYYKYGGMWKNKHEAVSAKMRKPAKQKKMQRIEADQKVIDHYDAEKEMWKQQKEDPLKEDLTIS